MKELQQQVDGAREAHALVVAELDVRASPKTPPMQSVGPAKDAGLPPHTCAVVRVVDNRH